MIRHAIKIVFLLIIIQCVTGVVWAESPEELKKAYVDQRLGLFIHFNMSTFARQPFLSVGGEHEIGQMPSFEDVDTNKDGRISPFEAENFRIFERIFVWWDVNTTPFERGMFECVYGTVPDENTVCKLSDKYFGRADVDKNGFLDEEEYHRIREHEGLFNPSELDVEQWAEAAGSAGVQYAVLVTKHHGGFSLWDSKASPNGNPGGPETTYDVASSPWPGVNGQKDIVRLFVDAFRQRGIKIGLYYSIWDKTHGMDANLSTRVSDPPNSVNPDVDGVPDKEFVKAQLSELLTRYGEISVLWFDGWGWKVAYDAVNFDEIRQHVYSFSPNTLIVENYSNWDRAQQAYRGMTKGVEAEGRQGDPRGAPIDIAFGDPPPNTDIVPFEQNFRGLPPKDNRFYAEVSDSIRAVEPKGVGAGENLNDAAQSIWFYHPEGNDELKNLDDIIDDLHTVNARKASYLLNITPDTTGRIPANQVELLEQIGNVKDLDNVNHLVDFYVVKYDAIPTVTGNCPNNDNDPNKKNKYGFKAVLENISGDLDPAQGRVVSLLQAKVNVLQNDNVLLLENGDYVGEGGEFMIPGGAGLIGAGLAPQGKIEIPFTVCLGSTDPFQLFVDVKGVIAFDDTAPALIQGNLGSETDRHNFEMVVREGGQLCHWWRRNDDKSNRWSKSACFAHDVKSAPAFIQSTFGDNGNFEVIYRSTNDTLRHYWRDNDDLGHPEWKLGNWSFGEDVASAPALIQSSGAVEKGKLELVYRDSANRLRHWWRDESTEDKEWESEGAPFGVNVSSAPALVQSDYREEGSDVAYLEVVVREGSRLRRYWRDSNKNWHKEPILFGANATSAPAFIQSSFGRDGGDHGNFEVIVKEAGSKLLGKGGGLRHYWRDNNSKTPEWHIGELLPTEDSATSAPTLIQSALESLANFELVVREGDKLVHYFRQNNEAEYPWVRNSDFYQGMTVRIMPVGDSITVGGNGSKDGSTKSYRYHLISLLEDAGINVDFVGSQWGLGERLPEWPEPMPGGDWDHEAYGGKLTGQIAEELENLNGNNQLQSADIALVHVGTNDRNKLFDKHKKELKRIITELRSANDKVTILLAKIIPCRDDGGCEQISDIYEKVEEVAREEYTSKSNVFVVDHSDAAGFSTIDHLHDPWHPNNEGEKLMARNWFNAIVGQDLGLISRSWVGGIGSDSE